MQALLVKIPDQRLGGGPGDADDVRRHLFFSDINWERLERKEVSTRDTIVTAANTDMYLQITPPFDPKVVDAFDLRNIDPEFVKETVAASAISPRVRSCV
jgi:hypothetical protein